MNRQIEHNLTYPTTYDRSMTDKPFLTIVEVAGRPYTMAEICQKFNYT